MSMREIERSAAAEVASAENVAHVSISESLSARQEVSRFASRIASTVGEFECVALGYLALSVYVTYMRDRTEIRASVWGGQSLSNRLDLVSLAGHPQSTNDTSCLYLIL